MKKKKKCKEPALNTRSAQLPVAFFYFCFFVRFIRFVSKLPVLDAVCLLPKTRGWQNASCSVFHATYRKSKAFLWVDAPVAVSES